MNFWTLTCINWPRQETGATGKTSRLGGIAKTKRREVVKGDPHELILRPTVCAGRPRLRLRSAEQAPEELLTALSAFLAPYRDGEAAAHETHERSVHT